MADHNVSQSYAEFIAPFSISCPNHGYDYWVALPGHVPPKDPRHVRLEDLHRVVSGKQSSKRLPECCLESLLLWRKEKTAPHSECCRASLYLYLRAVNLADALRPQREERLPPCCQAALRGHRWWTALEEAGAVTLRAGERNSIMHALYAHWMTVDRKEFLKATDDALLIFMHAYRAAGGTLDFRGQNHGELTRPLQKYLAALWQEMPRSPRRPSSAKEFVGRARDLAEGTLSWASGGTVRRWIRPNKLGRSDRSNKLVLQVVALSKHPRYTVGGRKMGERFSVAANLDCDKDRYLPVEEYWRCRLHDGDVVVIQTPPNRLRGRKNLKSTQA